MYYCFGKLSFTNHNTTSYLHCGTSIAANQKLFPTFWGNKDTIFGGVTQTSLSPIFFRGGSICTQASFS